MTGAETIVRAAGRLLHSQAQRDRLAALAFNDAGQGYDPFGLHPDWVVAAAGLLAPIYRHYFRVRSVGCEHVPSRGGAILAANHGGTLPIDGMMIVLDVALHTQPPRLPRVIGDLFIPRLPFVSTMFHRVGVVDGSRANTRRLLDLGELLLVFPEGVRGVGKPSSQRYKLQRWHVGHAELAIRHAVPVVPVAVIGAEEQWPQLARLPSGGLFGLPHLPVLATPLPLPVRYTIYYGEPMFFGGARTRRADDPDVVREAGGRVKQAVEQLVARGLAERRGVFS